MEMDAAKAREQLAEITDRQQQAATVGQRRPWWMPAGMAVLLLGFLLGLSWVEGLWGVLALSAGFLVGMFALSALVGRHQPVLVHPSQYVRSRAWLTMVGTAAGSAAVSVTVTELLGPGLPGAVLIVAGVMAIGVAGQRLSRWTLRHPTTPGGTTEGPDAPAARTEVG